MSKLKLNGNIELFGISLPVIEGGFGEDKKCILAKDIAEIHSKELKYINKQINSNRERFKDGTDIIDLKTGSSNELVLEMKESNIFTQAQIGNANNIYLLSERGYSKLIKIMDDDKSWEMHDELVDHYFALREQVKLSLTASEKAIIDIVQAKGEIAMAMAIRQYEDVVTEPLRLEVDKYERFLCDKLSTLTKKELATKLDTHFQTLAALFKREDIYTPKCQVKKDFLDKFPEIKMIKETESTYTTPTGQEKTKKDWQWTGEGAKAVVDHLIELGYVTFTDNKGFKLTGKK